MVKYMNLELETLKKEIQAIKEHLHKPVRFFKIYYELEYTEKIDIPLLLSDMNNVKDVHLSKIYINIWEHHDKTYDNPTHGIQRWLYKIYFWVVLHKPVDRDLFYKYFKTKIGAYVTEPFLRFDDFLSNLNGMKKGINQYYECSLMGELEKKKVPRVMNV